MELSSLEPGFRFHPTHEELVMFYLKRKVMDECWNPEVIRELDVYKFHPRDFQEQSYFKKERNSYFFCPRGRENQSQKGSDRLAEGGCWISTGPYRVVSYRDRVVGNIKSHVFHEGKAPKRKRTDWVMHVYKLEDGELADKGVDQDSYVLCKIFKKNGKGASRNNEQYGAPFVEEEWEDNNYETQNDVTCCTATVCTSDQEQQQFQSGVAASAVDQAPTSWSATLCASNQNQQQLHSAKVVDQALVTFPGAGVCTLDQEHQQLHFREAVYQPPTPFSHDYETPNVVSCWAAAVCTSDQEQQRFQSDIVTSAVDQAPTPWINIDASTNSYPNYNPEPPLVVQEPNPKSIYEDIFRMLDTPVSDGDGEVFGGLYDLRWLQP